MFPLTESVVSLSNDHRWEMVALCEGRVENRKIERRNFMGGEISGALKQSAGEPLWASGALGRMGSNRYLLVRDVYDSVE